jgi:sn-glycerol 3-phosphate transport system substrate-binding protein
VLAVGLLLGTLASACGSSSKQTTGASNLAFAQLPTCPVDALKQAKTPVKIQIWEGNQAEPENALKDLAAKFNASQKAVQVEVVHAGDSEDQVWTRYQSTVKDHGTLPALAVLDGFHTQALADLGTVLPAQSCLNADHSSVPPLTPAVRSYYSIGGVQWPAYAYVTEPLMFYNRDHFKRAGLNPDDPPKTVAGVVAAAKKLQSSGVTKHPIAMPLDPIFIESWLTGSGTDLVSNADGRSGPATRATFFSQPALQLYGELQQLLQSGQMVLYPDADGQITHLVQMATGAASITFEMTTISTSVQSFLQGDLNVQSLPGSENLTRGDVTKDAEYAAAPLPGLSAPGRVGIQGMAWYLSSEAPPEQQAAAWTFVKFLLEPANSAYLLTKGSFLPATTAAQADPAVAPFFSSGLAGQWMKLGQKEFDSVDPSRPGPLVGPYTEFRDAVRLSLTKLAEPNVTPVQALSTAELTLSDALHEYQLQHP